MALATLTKQHGPAGPAGDPGPVTGRGHPAPPVFDAAYPGYRATGVLDDLRTAEYGYLDATGHAYLDYTGAGLAAQAQLSAHAARLRGRCFGNPHSENPASAASTELIERTREAVRRHFNAPPEEYAVIFTPNASGACRLVGEAYPFGRGRRFVLTSDNHNSVHGIREFARARGAAVRYIPFGSPDLRVDDDAVTAALRPRRLGPARRGLFAFPAQSNFTGVQHELRWIDLARERGYDVLLDAAAYVPANRLDLSALRPDFVPVSWYKVFGYPTGVGCLIARREALARLRRPWFAGGTIAAVSVQGGWHAPAGGEAWFEDGTPSFLTIPDVAFGLSWINRVDADLVRERLSCLTGWLLDRLGGLRHGNGQPMARIHGPAGLRRRGGTVAFSLLDPRGVAFGVRAVERATAAAGISIRTGCFCNPGAAEAALGLTRPDLAQARRSGARTADEFAAAAGIPGGGAIRASVGLASNVADVDRLLALIEDTYRDQPAPAVPGGPGSRARMT
ncbi:MAG TPA: aminotransferase class V-fold PLP-dependent enzyme [Streptosporangiaceae bacterium]|nr:aminotransferase class V-fold PLP-dependent enzyme [Streptosporangiaceae bacterium]